MVPEAHFREFAANPIAATNSGEKKGAHRKEVALERTAKVECATAETRGEACYLLVHVCMHSCTLAMFL